MIEERDYFKYDVISFFKTNEEFGLLSNMKGKQKILVNDICFSSSEAIYQALKFPDNEEIQLRIAYEKSPIFAKRIASSNKQFIRGDWEIVKNNVMRLSLRIRTLQSQEFYDTLLSKKKKKIVEISRKDIYWGTITKANNLLSGKNVLGRLLMELREEIIDGNVYDRTAHILNTVSNIKINSKKIDMKSLIGDAKKNHMTFEFKGVDLPLDP